MWSTAAAKGVARSLRLSARMPRSMPLLLSSRGLATSCTKLSPQSLDARSSPPRARFYSTDGSVDVQTVAEVPHNVRYHKISTLDPHKLTREDYLDISGSDWPFVKFTTERSFWFAWKEGAPMPDSLPIQTFVSTRSTSTTGALLPDRTAGFLYLKRAPEGAPEIAAEIRMRITNDPDPSSFSNGTDLKQNGLPWSCPLIQCNIAWSLSLMKRDGMLSETAQAGLRDLANPYKPSWKTKAFSTVLYSRSQPFLVDFSRREVRLGLNAKIDGRETLRLLKYSLPKKAVPVTRDEAADAEPADGKSKKSPPLTYEPLYTGKAICRISWTTDRKGTWCGLRLLKILEPLRPMSPDLPELKEGSIVPHFDFLTGALIESQKRMVDITAAQKSSAAILYMMPDIPVDSE